jgi:prepilin-type N-terminal cleavage/methylation domain-containing protein
MKLINSKTIQKDRGFTIVELLIVIVVIAILAAITIIAYNGIQNRARTTKAQTNAAAVQKVAEAYNAINGTYPITQATLRAGDGTTSLPAAVLIVTNAGNPLATPTPVTSLTTANGEASIQYDIISGGAGARVVYWDFTTSKPSTNILYLGTGASGSTFIVTPA